jgi:hypothetical protein
MQEFGLVLDFDVALSLDKNCRGVYHSAYGKYAACRSEYAASPLPSPDP